mmetsp:Transcript_97167/g.280431  ORF Transcript_97167/g.280431 Transcript_97167/m.280431 type:complete len:210 (-) Transcript_97167:49-678(-)
MCNGRSPRRSSALTSATPLSSNRSATSRWPRRTARCNGVAPHSSATSADAPLPSSNIATAACPFPAARCNGVELQRSALCALAPPRSNLFATPSCPTEAATCNGVAKCRSPAFASAPLLSSTAASGACCVSWAAARWSGASAKTPPWVLANCRSPRTRRCVVFKRLRSTDSWSGLLSAFAGRCPRGVVSRKGFAPRALPPRAERENEEP